MDYEVKYQINCQSKHGLSDFSVKTGKFLLAAHRSKKHVLFRAQSKIMLFVMGYPHLQIKPNL